jgi:hypothetical protein
MGLDDKTAGTHLTEDARLCRGAVQAAQGRARGGKADVEAALLALTDTAGGNIVLRFLQGRLADSGIRIAGQTTPQGALTREDLKTLSATRASIRRTGTTPMPTSATTRRCASATTKGYKALGNSA